MKTSVYSPHEDEIKVKPIIATGPHREPNPIEDEVRKVMESWQFDVASGKAINIEPQDLGKGNAIKLDDVKELIEWKRIDGKAVKVVSFNIYARLGEVREGRFWPRMAYALESHNGQAFAGVPVTHD